MCREDVCYVPPPSPLLPVTPIFIFCVAYWSKWNLQYIFVVFVFVMGWPQRLTFLGFFYAMRSLVPVGHFRNISGHLFTWLVCGSFQWHHGILFTDCTMWDGKDKQISLGRRMMEYPISKTSTVSIITAFTHHKLSTDIFSSLLSMKYDIKIQNAAIWRFLRWNPTF